MQNLVILVAVYIYIYIYRQFYKTKKKINLINKVRVGVNSTLKSIYKEKRKT